MHHTIEVEDLYFTYPDGREALRGVNLTVPPGVKMTLVGPNGAGKSTLMLHLNGILRGEGRVRVAGMEMNEENLPRIRAAVGMVFQNPDDQLFSPTVLDDLAFGPLHMGLPEADGPLRVV
ncbi:cobalt ABC transporter ATP-binding protein, partial [Litorilinea aerophila]